MDRFQRVQRTTMCIYSLLVLLERLAQCVCCKLLLASLTKYNLSLRSSR